MISREECQRLDREDPLSHLRDRFILPEGVIYLDGNSLGALPASVPERIEQVVREEWGGELIKAWNTRSWIDLPAKVGERIARLIGAEPGSVIVCDSTSINLYKAVSAALRLRPDRPLVLSDRGNFPTDLYVMSGLAEVRLVELEEVLDAITADVGVVALTEVDYRTGRRHDLREITAAAHAAGAIMVWDLAHSAGAFEVDLAAAGADMAVGCGYKYLNGGPGAPAFLYVAPPHHQDFANPIRGWLGHASPFDFSLEFVPADGIGRGQVGTPPVLSLAALDAALDLFDGLEMTAVRAKSIGLTELFIELFEDRLASHGFELATPRDPDHRGSQVSLRHEHAYPVVKAAIDRGVIGDFRAPDVARFGFTPLYLRYVDVWEAVEVIVRVMETEAWRDPAYAVRAKVT